MVIEMRGTTEFADRDCDRIISEHKFLIAISMIKFWKPHSNLEQKFN